jgi:hypothetical protein
MKTSQQNIYQQIHHGAKALTLYAIESHQLKQVVTKYNATAEVCEDTNINKVHSTLVFSNPWLQPRGISTQPNITGALAPFNFTN